jgi:hypothetical protein
VRRSRCSLEGVGGGDNRVRGSGPLQPWGKGASGPQEHRRNDGDAIVPAVGVRTGRDDCAIQKVVADLASQPVKVSYIVVTDGPGEPYLEGDHPLIWTHDDQGLCSRLFLRRLAKTSSPGINSPRWACSSPSATSVRS